MDEIDLALSLMLMANSRVPYKELADIFSMSVNSIHKRVKSLVELGIIRNFSTKLGYTYFKQIINVVLYGRSLITDKKALIDDLGSHECIYNVTQASGDLFYIHAYIRNLAELDTLVSFIRDKGEFRSLNVGLDKNSPSIIYKNFKPPSVSPLDYKIIYSMRINSRRTISEIAEDLGLQTKQKSILNISHSPELFANQWICFSYEGQDILDVFFASEDDFNKLYKNSELKKDKSLSVRVACLDDITTMKKGSGRPIDLADLKSIKESKKYKK